MPDIYMPRLSDSMEEGTIFRWLKGPGDEVHRGEELVEIETDKATVAYESEYDGVLEIVARPGTTIAVGELIGYVGPRSAHGGDAGTVVSEGEAEPPTVPGFLSSAAASFAVGVNVSPTARRLAEAHGLDLDGITGTGPHGRITRADVSASISLSDGQSNAQSGNGADSLASGHGEVTRQALTRTQQTVARRMAESRSTVPDFSVDFDVQMDSASEALAELRASEAARDTRPTVTDLIVKACGLALREFPYVNGAYRNGEFEQYSRANIGIAVAAPRSLVVPTVFDVDQKTVIEVAEESLTLAGRVRDETISPAELSSATFTVSNLGMYGVRAFRAIINPPQAAILAVGALRSVPTLLDGSLVERQLMTLTLSCDHRILYGTEAAQFLAGVAALLEAPTEWCLATSQ